MDEWIEIFKCVFKLKEQMMTISESVDINFGKRFVVFMEKLFVSFSIEENFRVKPILLSCKTSC